jgi:hypothetical protein
VLISVVVIRVRVVAKDQHLTNEVERVRAAAKATMASFKAVELCKLGNGCIVGVRVIEHKIAEVAANIKGFERFSDDFSYPLTSISAGKLRQRDGQVPDGTRGVTEISDNTKEATLAAFYCLSVKADINLADRQR